MGVIRVILKRDSILENNMVQTIGSAGESGGGRRDLYAAGFIYVDERLGKGSPVAG